MYFHLAIAYLGLLRRFHKFTAVCVCCVYVCKASQCQSSKMISLGSFTRAIFEEIDTVFYGDIDDDSGLWINGKFV